MPRVSFVTNSFLFSRSGIARLSGKFFCRILLAVNSELQQLVRVHRSKWGLFFFFCCIVLAGCSSGQNEEIIATVQGTPVYFYEVEAQRNMLFSGLDEQGNPPDDALLREQYRYALQQIVTQELIRQYLEKKHLLPDPSVISAEIEAVEADYGYSGFEQILLVEGISPVLWRKAMERRALVTHFVDVVIKPKVTISSEEIEAYYLTHKDKFFKPEQWHYMALSGPRAEDVRLARDEYLFLRNATAVQRKFGVSLREIRMDKTLVAQPWLKELSELAPFSEGNILQDGDDFQTVILLEDVPAGELEPIEIYKRIEIAIKEDKVQKALDTWVRKQMDKATITMHLSLFPQSLESDGSGYNANGTVQGSEEILSQPPLPLEQETTVDEN